jgi:hypothetical protein
MPSLEYGKGPPALISLSVVLPSGGRSLTLISPGPACAANEVLDETLEDDWELEGCSVDVDVKFGNDMPPLARLIMRYAAASISKYRNTCFQELGFILSGFSKPLTYYAVQVPRM